MTFHKASIKIRNQEGRLYDLPILLLVLLPAIIVLSDFMKYGFTKGLIPALEHLGIIAVIFLFLFLGAGGLNLFRSNVKPSENQKTPLEQKEKMENKP